MLRSVLAEHLQLLSWRQTHIVWAMYYSLLTLYSISCLANFVNRWGKNIYESHFSSHCFVLFAGIWKPTYISKFKNAIKTRGRRKNGKPTLIPSVTENKMPKSETNGKGSCQMKQKIWTGKAILICMLTVVFPYSCEILPRITGVKEFLTNRGGFWVSLNSEGLTVP